MVDETERRGVLRLGLPSKADSDDPGLRQRCSVVAGLVGHLAATRVLLDLFEGRRQLIVDHYTSAFLRDASHDIAARIE